MTVQLLTQPKAIAPQSIPPKKWVTGEELFKMGDIGRTELIKGEIIYLMPTGLLHGIIEFAIAAILRNFVQLHQLGYVFGGETGIYITREPDTVRGVDAAYISHERFAQIKSTSYLDVAPELVVEVMSPDDSWTEINDKIEEYFAIGVVLIWIVNPKRKLVHVYRSPTTLEILRAHDTLTGDEVLPGFAVPLTELFG